MPRPVRFSRTPVMAGVGLHFDLEDVEDVQYKLLNIQQYLENTLVLAEAAKASMQVDMARHFDAETDPDGDKWAELVRPAFDQQGILQLTGAMRDAAISEEAWSATPMGVFFDASTLPEYWPHHDIGSSHIPRGPRRFIGTSEVEKERIYRLGDEWLAGGIMLGTRGFIKQARAPAGTFMSFT